MQQQRLCRLLLQIKWQRPLCRFQIRRRPRHSEWQTQLYLSQQRLLTLQWKQVNRMPVMLGHYAIERLPACIFPASLCVVLWHCWLGHFTCKNPSPIWPTEWRRINQTIYFVLYFYNKIHKCDNVRVAPKTLVKAVLSVSSTGCNNERQSFAKLSYCAIDNVLTNLLPAGLQDFFQVLNVLNATRTVNKLLECSSDWIVRWV